ncbi:hypothetical protein V8E54_014872 [Elaphomyces granulatus]
MSFKTFYVSDILLETRAIMSAIPMNHEDYTVAWICALPLEAAASKTILDKTHPQLSQPAGDDNAYTLGEISGHNIVIACLPSGTYGTIPAATVAANMRITFPSIRFGLMVGIGGGVPSTNNDIRLGDVVVSKPSGVLGGVVQYDHGKTVASGVFQQTGMMNRPPQVLLNAIAQLHADEIFGNNQGIVEAISNVGMKYAFSRPTDEQDRLFNSAYDHPQADTSRPPNFGRTSIHYGLIASGNQVMKHGKTRDRLAKEYVMLCFEMEAAGLMNQLPCLVIRGICDYSDSHKSKQWQGYAALTAAAYAKILLSVVPMNQFRKKQTSQEACWMVPFERNPRFLGRHNEVVKLEEKILSSDQVRKMAITGLGGVGKTQIALELTYQVRHKRPEYPIFWIPATSIEKIEQAYMGIGEHLGLQDVAPADMKMRVKAHLSSEKAGSWLLIIDNVDDMDIWVTSDGSSPALKTCIPQSKYGFVLFTTRNRQLATKLVGPEVISISQMDDKTATDLLRASLIDKDLVNDRQTTSQLLCQLSCLPLAIIQAASYINETGISVAIYLSLLNRQENVMVELLSQDFEDEWRYAESKNPVAVTWLISFYQIQKLNPLAADYLSFMSCIDPRDIPQSLLPPDGSEVKQQNALGLLKAYSFITGQADDRTISLHRLVHVATRNWLRNGGMLGQWTVNTGKRLRDIFPSSDHKNRILWREYLPHALFIVQSKEFQNDTQEREQLGRWTEAEKLFVQVMETRKTLLGPEHPDTLTSMANLASTYRNQGRWTEAEKLEVQVMETRKAVLGPEHPDTLTSMASLASTYWNQGRWTESEKLGVQVMERRKTALGPEHPDTLSSIANLACTYRNQGRWTEAEKLDGRWTEAEKLNVQVMETFKTVLGPEHPDTLTSMANLACIYRNQGRWTEEEQLFVQVVETSKTVLGPDHPVTLKCRHVEALSMLQACVELQDKRLGPTHPHTVAATAHLKNWQGLFKYSTGQSPF